MCPIINRTIYMCVCVCVYVIQEIFELLSIVLFF